ncbi:hydrolase [Reticulibacter mediterranei]|uniref:Hydrolase n=1 Tax=Reticulibacter mediterranei TaxID=2778369 RepID=A0A8J3ITX8_9CHLR|nr:alpha/beta hydrolase [Reticulibacter mediterranei]GHO98533.1 hydrolase [Reticulibacter mediterranei]
MSLHPVDGSTSGNGLQLHYRRWSAPSPDPHLPPILLLHGLASAASIWNLVAPLLAEQGYHVIALDQRGHGESDKPETGYDFASIIFDDHIAMKTLDLERPILVGHSWGAAVALHYAAVHTENVTALVLVDGATNQLSLRPNWSRDQAIQALAPPRFAGMPRETFLSFYRRGPLAEQWTAELEESILQIVHLREDDTVAPRLDFEHHLQIIGAMWDQPLFDLYRQVRCPLKLIVAEQQPTNDTQATLVQIRRQGIEQIHALRPDIHIVWMPDTIHDIPFHRPAHLAQEILSP